MFDKKTVIDATENGLVYLKQIYEKLNEQPHSKDRLPERFCIKFRANDSEYYVHSIMPMDTCVILNVYADDTKRRFYFKIIPYERIEEIVICVDPEEKKFMGFKPQ